ncbi:ORF6N domain-containing protein [bacterium]|nr:ORF6N domain-containing protein [bacterium]
MENEIIIHNENQPKLDIESKILVIRGQHVMIDRDLAELYGVETKVLNQAVKRNIERFPEDFCFQLNKAEFEIWRSQFVTSNSDKMGLRRPPYVFTEQGVAMLSSVLRSKNAVEINIQIMRVFVALRRFLKINAQVFQRLDFMEKRQINTELHLLESDKKIDELFDRMDRYKIEDEQGGIFFQGQIFDAYAKFESFIAEAEKEIILIDNYVDLTVLERFAKKKSGVKVRIYTYPKTKITSLDIQKFNEQYPLLELNHTEKIHDRFLIIDNKILYHIGASLKDLGKKCFGFEILDSSWIQEIMRNL